MTENEGTKAAVKGTGEGARRDLVALTDSPAVSGEGTAHDSILSSAHAFEEQLEQMTSWKHQLAQQMELMRRDGIKLLERQKSLSVEKKRLLEEREGLAADRERLEKLQARLGEEAQALRAKEAEIATARGELEQLESERAKWEEDTEAAKIVAAELDSKRAAVSAALGSSEARLAEIEGVVKERAAQGDTLLREIEAGRRAVAAIEEERKAAEGARHEWTQREAELRAREGALAQQEAKNLAEGVQLREALEQLEEQRKQLIEAQRAVAREKEATGTAGVEERRALESLTAELATREGAIVAKNAEIAEREGRLLSEKTELAAARAELASVQERLSVAEGNLAQRTAGVEGDLEMQLKAAAAARVEAEGTRDGLIKQRRELEKNLGEMESELAGQLEALAKQTLRLTERRNEIEARSEALEKEFEVRVAQETERLREELLKSQRGYEERAAALEQQIEEANATSGEWEAREVQLQAELDVAGTQLEMAKQEVVKLTAQFAEAEGARQGAVNEEVAEWRKKLEAAKAENERLQAAQAESAVLEGKSGEAEGKLAALAGEIDEARAKLAEAEARGRALEEQLSKIGSGGSEQVEALGRQVEMLEQQRNDLAAQLFTAQDTLKRQSEESLLEKNGVAGELLQLRQRNAALETELAAAGSGRAYSSEDNGEAQQAIEAHRERLLRQARNVRAYRKQVRETKTTLEQHREEIASQREQLRSRKENLEQVKRLLEKQEMVMARKLADHSAVKTVAAVGIFVIMILGSVFAGVYKFVNPSFRSEAVVQLVPPTGASGPELQAWMGRQVEFMKADDVTFAAWKMLRTPDEHYGMHDVREEWLGSLSKNLALKLDAGTKTVSVQYTGPSADGVAQVCNALATSYATPTAREGSSEEARGFGTGAAVLAKASSPQFPVEDNRLMLSLSIVAVVLFLSLILVIVFRHYVARQLREIDQMADDKDLEEIKGEMAAVS